MQTNDANDPKSLNTDDATTLAGAGVDVAGGSSENIAEGEKEEVEVVDIDGTAGADVTPVAGMKFVEEAPKPTEVPDLAALAEAKQKKEESSRDLEAQFNSELHDFKGPVKSAEPGVVPKPTTLAALLSKIQGKLGTKKASVKEELGSLKKMKDAIGHDIEEIKELEADEKKIEDEINKIETINQEVEAIEKDLAEKGK